MPELASRDHARSGLRRGRRRRSTEAGLAAEDAVDGVAVTAGRGSSARCSSGLSFGKALAYRLGVPVVGVHHLAGHLASAEIADPELRWPRTWDS